MSLDPSSAGRLLGLGDPGDRRFLKWLNRLSFKLGDEGDLDLASGDVGDGGEMGSSGNDGIFSSTGDAKTLPVSRTFKKKKRR